MKKNNRSWHSPGINLMKGPQWLSSLSSYYFNQKTNTEVASSNPTHVGALDSNLN